MSSADEVSSETSSGGALLLAALSAAAAAIHFSVLQAHFDESVVFGVFFGAVALLQLLFALLVIRDPDRRVLIAGAWGNAGVALVWVMSRVVGVPFGAHPWEAEPVTFLDSAATAFEVVIALLIPARVRLAGWLPVSGAATALVLATAGIAVTDPHVHVGSGLDPGEIERTAFTGGSFDGEISTVPLYGGYIEGFLEQLGPGGNAVHVGFFTRSGAELPIETIEISYRNGSKQAEVAEPERLARSHFVAPLELTAGEWTFRIQAITESGQRFVTQFQQQVKP